MFLAIMSPISLLTVQTGWGWPALITKEGYLWPAHSFKSRFPIREGLDFSVCNPKILSGGVATFVSKTPFNNLSWCLMLGVAAYGIYFGTKRYCNIDYLDFITKQKLQTFLPEHFSQQGGKCPNECTPENILKQFFFLKKGYPV